MLRRRVAMPGAGTGQDQVEADGDNAAQGDALEAHAAVTDDHAANAEDQGDGDDDQVARLAQIDLVADQGIQADHGDRTGIQVRTAARVGQ